MSKKLKFEFEFLKIQKLLIFGSRFLRQQITFLCQKTVKIKKPAIHVYKYKYLLIKRLLNNCLFIYR